jgi:hypothetical protein
VGLVRAGRGRLAARDNPPRPSSRGTFPAWRSAPSASRQTRTPPPAQPCALFCRRPRNPTRAAVRAVAIRARNDLSTVLGIEVPATITLRVHPTVEAYQRASGQPWFTPGATAAPNPTSATVRPAPAGTPRTHRSDTRSRTC